MEITNMNRKELIDALATQPSPGEPIRIGSD